MILCFVLSLLVRTHGLVPPSSFDDHSLAQLLAESKKSHSKFIIYTWSPNMALSIKGLSEILQNPIRNRAKLVILRDPASDIKIAQRIVEENHWPDDVLREATATELIRLGVRAHFPSYIFGTGNGKLGPIVPGYKDPARLDLFARRYWR